MLVRRPPVHKPGDKVFRVPRLIPWSVPAAATPTARQGPLSPVLLLYGFLGLIAIGTILLILPFSSQEGRFTPFMDAFFTAVSAVCVTGLTVVDTADYWSHFGQGVILVLIQLGGFGFMSSATILLLAFGRRIGLRGRLLIGEALGIPRLGGLIALTLRMALFTAGVESLGALALFFHFSRTANAGTAAWRAVFQSVSAFNNAGFDVFGNFRSLMDFQTDVVMLLVTAALLIIGGLGFVVLADLVTARGFDRLSLDSKLVLLTTGVLLLVGFVVILLTEAVRPETLGSLSPPYKMLDAFFQAVAPRTAGFSVVDMAVVADYTLFFTTALMFIGGAAGSTAGGIKVDTLGLLAATIVSSLRGREFAGAFGREFTRQGIQRALAVVMLSLTWVVIVAFVLTATEGSRFLDLLFETVSAYGTVGLSAGVTPTLSVAGRAIIALTMYVGRLGPLTLALALIQRQRHSTYRYPEGLVRIG